MATPNREAIKDVQNRVREQGLCGALDVDVWDGKEFMCIRSAPCKYHGDDVATPQQEPEGDGWEITEDDVRVCIGERASQFVSPEEWEGGIMLRDRLRARVQPRRVSREEFDRAVLAAEITIGHGGPAEAVVRTALSQLGFTITPTEGDDG